MNGSRLSFRTRLITVIAGLGGALAAAIVLLTVGERSTASIPGSAAPAGTVVHHAAVALGAGPPSPGRLGTVHFHSAALGGEADYLVYLPRETVPRRRLPVFYLLHGMPGRPLAFTVDAHIERKLEALIRARRIAPMILVFPDGRVAGRTASDSEWADTPSGRYDSYVADVVRNVDRRFAVIRSRRARAIAGLSAGAYGAANVGLHHVRLFGLIQAWGGYFTETRSGVFAHASPTALADNSPIDYVRRIGALLRRYPLRTFLYAGRHDSFAAQTEPMAATLAAEGVHSRWAIYPGGHSWALWSARVDQMLEMANHDFRHPLPVPRAAHRHHHLTAAAHRRRRHRARHRRRS